MDNDHRARGTWRGRVENEAARIEDELEFVTAAAGGGKSPVQGAIERNIARAREAAGPAPLRTRLLDWFTGVSFETAWASLHAADELLTVSLPSEDLRARRPDLVAALEANLRPGDSRLDKYQKSLGICDDMDAPDDKLRAEIRAARHTANTAAYVAQGVVRRWRNLLLVVGTAVAVGVVAMAAVDAAVGKFLPLGHNAPDVWEVELMGAFGGAIAAVLAINRFSGFTDPNGLPLYQALLRIPMAAAASLLGILLLQSGVIDALKPQKSEAVLAYAVLFGYAQEPLLRAIDRRAGQVLEPARGKDDPANTPSHVSGSAAP